MTACQRLHPVGLTIAAALTVVAGCHRSAPEQPAAEQSASTAAEPVAAPTADPYHLPPRDTVDAPLYTGWQQFSLQCARCHGEDAQGSSFGPSLLEALRPDGAVPTRAAFLEVLAGERADKGMPSAEQMGIDSTYFTGLYDYLKGRSDGRFHGGRPERKE
ncbi:MAG TPA: c-type cytochrome [Gemmatimonadales bacterium]|nr:c-type cytochrome [Gemmatimonadales bacterium]